MAATLASTVCIEWQEKAVSMPGYKKEKQVQVNLSRSLQLLVVWWAWSEWMSDPHPQNSVQRTGIKAHFALTLPTWSGPGYTVKSGEGIH